jgi:hypothetical protein
VLRAGMLDAVRQGASSAVLTVCALPPAPNWLHPKLLLLPAVPDLSLPDAYFLPKRFKTALKLCGFL